MPHVKLQKYKGLMLPVSIIAGGALYKWMGYLTFLSPYLIFIMLTVTYCRIEPREFKIRKPQWVLLGVQMLLSAVTYFALKWVNPVLASGVFICVFIPTATAAPVITGMLGGSIAKVATFSLISNITVAIVGPVVLAAIGDHPEMGFEQSFYMICSRVLPLLILPMITAFILRYSARKFHDTLASHQPVSFYLWAISLFIVVGSSVSFAINHYTSGAGWLMIWLATGALVVCLIQFAVGRRIGRIYGDEISAGQSLGQKNTVLAIWLSIAYLNPIASIAPAAYVAWQNCINSWELMHHRKQLQEK